MKRVAKVYGAEDATAILDLDLVVVNKTLYVPWSSAQNGRSSGMSFAQISLAANEEATFNFRFEDSTSGEVTPIAYGARAFPRVPLQGTSSIWGCALALSPTTRWRLGPPLAEQPGLAATASI